MQIETFPAVATLSREFSGTGISIHYTRLYPVDFGKTSHDSLASVTPLHSWENGQSVAGAPMMLSGKFLFFSCRGHSFQWHCHQLVISSNQHNVYIKCKTTTVHAVIESWCSVNLNINERIASNSGINQWCLPITCCHSGGSCDVGSGWHMQCSHVSQACYIA